MEETKVRAIVKQKHFFEEQGINFSQQTFVLAHTVEILYIHASLGFLLQFVPSSRVDNK